MKVYRRQLFNNSSQFGNILAVGVLAAVALGAPRLAKADEVFNVDVPIGNGSVIGTITTDGTLGTLAQSDITGLDLTINAPFGSATATNPADDFYTFAGSDLSETASALIFNFSGNTGGGMTILSDDGSEAWTLGEGGFIQSICGSVCDPAGTPGVEDDSRVAPMYYTQLTGDVALGTTAPEPGALFLFATGLIGLAVVRFGQTGRVGKFSRSAKALPVSNT